MALAHPALRTLRHDALIEGQILDSLRRAFAAAMRRLPWHLSSRAGVTRALRHGRVDVLIEALAFDPSLAVHTDERGWTLLHEAAHLRQPRAAEILLEAGAAPDAATPLGVTPLFLAIESRDLGTVSVLAHAGADLARPLDAKGRTALHLAAERNDRALAELLLRHGADPHALDYRHATPWGRALDKPVFKLLDAAPRPVALTPPQVSRPTQPPAQSTFGFAEARLLRAVEKGETALVRSLLDEGANFNAHDDRDRTLLMTAAEAGHREIAALLLDRGADACAVHRESGQTPLHFAAAAGHEEIVTLLLIDGARIEMRDVEGRTALHLAARGCHTLCLTRLLAAGAYIDTPDAFERTPLHHACAYAGDPGPRVQTISLMLSRSADLRARDAHGRTPLHLAAAVGCTWTLRMLATRGAPLHANDAEYLTPRDYALLAGKADVLDLLAPR